MKLSLCKKCMLIDFVLELTVGHQSQDVFILILSIFIVGWIPVYHW